MDETNLSFSLDKINLSVQKAQPLLCRLSPSQLSYSAHLCLPPTLVDLPFNFVGFDFTFSQTNLDLVWIKPISPKIGTLAMPYEDQPSFWAPFYVPTIRQKAPLFKKHCEN